MDTQVNWLSQQFELARGGAQGNVQTMEGLRGFAVFLVFLVHYVSEMRPWMELNGATELVATALWQMGQSGVDLFFVLSGYLIYGSVIAKPTAFARFMARRYQRIYPAFGVVFAIYLLLSLVFPAQSKIPPGMVQAAWYLLANFLLLPGVFDIEALITVAWSLSYEMLYYLCIPLAVALLRLRQRTSATRIALFASAALLLAGYCTVWGGHARMLLFFAGILLYEALHHSAWRAPGSVLAACALLLGLAGTQIPLAGPSGYTLRTSILCLSFFMLCASCFQTPTSPLARAFSWTPLRWLGNMSYSYYLLHGLSLKAIALLLQHASPPAGKATLLFWAGLTPAFALSLLPAAALFLAVERPYSLSPRPQRAAQRGPQ